MMHWWCPDDALMMHWWCTDDALMLDWWCTVYDMMHIGQVSDYHWRFYGGRINGDKTWRRQPTTTGWIEQSASGRYTGRVLQYEVWSQYPIGEMLGVEISKGWPTLGGQFWEMLSHLKQNIVSERAMTKETNTKVIESTVKKSLWIHLQLKEQFGNNRNFYFRKEEF